MCTGICGGGGPGAVHHTHTHTHTHTDAPLEGTDGFFQTGVSGGHLGLVTEGQVTELCDQREREAERTMQVVSSTGNVVVPWMLFHGCTTEALRSNEVSPVLCSRLGVWFSMILFHSGVEGR